MRNRARVIHSIIIPKDSLKEKWRPILSVCMCTNEIGAQILVLKILVGNFPYVVETISTVYSCFFVKYQIIHVDQMSVLFSRSGVTFSLNVMKSCVARTNVASYQNWH